MIVSIHQPNFIPYQGYFNKIKNSDVFVIYDTAQYVKDRWDNRNMIRNKNGAFYLTIPLKDKDSLKKRFYETKLPKEEKWKRKHINSFIANYSKSNYFNALFSFLEKHYSSDISTLSEFNSKIITHILRILDIDTKIIFSSKLDIDKSLKSTEALIQILKEVGASKYLSGPSGKSYLDINKFYDSNIDLEFQSFKSPKYKQPFVDFIPNLSILDLLFNEGILAKDFI